MIRYSAIAGFIFLLLATSCLSQPNCDAGFQKYEVYLYRTPEQRFLFFKKDPRRPIDFNAEESSFFLETIDKIFSSYYGRSIGVEASVCGRIERIDLPLSPYTQSLFIRQAAIVGNVDLTVMIEEYEKSLGYPAKNYGEREYGDSALN